MTGSPPTSQLAEPAAETDRALGWSSVAIHAGGAGLLDAALAQVLAPAITEAEPSSWFFERYAAAGALHLRVHSRARDTTDAEGLAPRLTELLRGISDEAGAEPLLPRPASQRGGDGPRRVEPATLPLDRPGLSGPDQLERSAPLFQASSKLALDVIRDQPSAHARMAHAFRICAQLAEIGAPAAMHGAVWDEVARSWTGDDNRGRRLRGRLGQKATELESNLLASARELERSVDAADLAPVVAAAEELFGEADSTEAPALVCLHAHLSCNRLGITPLEEAVLALLLAGGAAKRLERAHDTDDSDTPHGTETATDTPQTDGDGAVLRLRAVIKEHDERAALRGVSFEVQEGELFGLFGPRGAGKTSVLAVAAGLRLPSSGSVLALGVDPLEGRGRLADEVMLVAADHEVAEQATVRENLELRARSHGVGEASPDAVLSEVGLAAEAATHVDELSPGARRLLSIACALVSAPRLLLVDEPSAGLSPVAREPVWELLRAQRAAGRTVVIATSSMQEARALCDRVAVVVEGTVLAVEEPEQIAERFAMRTLVFDTEAEPDRAALEDLPEVGAVRIDQHAGHWTLTIETLQPDELLRLVESDPAFPAAVNLRGEDQEAGFPEPGAW